MPKTADEGPRGPSALVLDVMLPDKDGFSVARECRLRQKYHPASHALTASRPPREDV